jgi:hypothetical protein
MPLPALQFVGLSSSTLVALHDGRIGIAQTKQGSVGLTNGCALEGGVGFRQLRTCRRTRPGQLSARSGHGVLVFAALIGSIYLWRDQALSSWRVRVPDRKLILRR